MKLDQVAVQLYTLREFCKTESDLAVTLAKVKEIGYQAAQISGIGADIAPAKVRQICTDHGIINCATHEKSDLIRKDPLAAVERVKASGASLSAYPYPAGVDFSDPASVKAMISDLGEAARIFAENDCRLAYHNHAIEFVRMGEETILDHILRATGDQLGMELDTYWVQYGGADPVAWCTKATGRLPALHLKDYSFTTENKPAFAEVGHGNLDFAKIIPAAEAAGCKWFIVEQDICPGDPFDSVRKSFEYIKANLCS